VRILYVDSSAITKRYSAELGSAWVGRQTDGRSGNGVVLSVVARVEVVSALARKAREGHIDVADRDRAVRAFRTHCGRRYRFVALADDVIRLAAELVSRNPLRDYDSVQLASALSLNRVLVEAGRSPLTFVCADQDLCAIAQREGLHVENPEHHP
jgi:predicted nucleic acid-binding protein